MMPRRSLRFSIHRPLPRAFALLAATATLGGGVFAEDLAAQYSRPLLNPEVRELLHEELSGEWAREQMIHISRNSRVQGSRGYRDASRHVLAELRKVGFSEADAYIESAVSDLKAEYQTWISPSGWHVEDAELRMVEPRNELITRWTDLPISVATYSNSGHARGELVFVGRGDRESDYVGKDVAGKIVLCSGSTGPVHRLAVLQHGALAVACYLNDARTWEHPDLVAYTGLWPRPGEEANTTFGFNLSRRQGESLRALLEAGERVVLEARIDGPGLEPYFMDTPVAWIRGSTRPEEVLVFTAHLDHPKESANDNASGSAAILDMARTLHTLIESGRMARPERSILFLWVSEYYGTMAYVDAHPEMMGRPMGGDYLASINLDMVGEHLEKLHSKMMIRRSPLSNPSILNDVVANMAEMLDDLEIRTPRGSQSVHNYRVTPHSGGSDHVMMNALHIPAMMIGHDDWTHHSSADTPENVDPVQLQRSEMIALSAMLHLSELTEEEGRTLAWHAAGKALGRIGELAFDLLAEMEAAGNGRIGSVWAEAENALTHRVAWEGEALRTILHFRNTPAVVTAVEGAVARIEADGERVREQLRGEARRLGATGSAPPALPGRGDDRVPVRLTRSSLQSHNTPVPQRDLTGERAAWYTTPGNPLTGEHRTELVNFIDGTRTITAIRDAVSAGYGAVPTEAVARYIDDLVTVGVVEYR